MTSMFFFGPNDRKDVDDFRPSVHDSDGLAIFNGRGEELWRPLHNPRDLQISLVRRPQPARFRPDAASEGFCRLSGPRIEFRTPAEPVGGADRRLGRRRGQAARNSNQGRSSRQYCSILAAQDGVAGKGRAHLHLSAALGTGRPEADRAGAIFPNRHRRKGRQRHALRAGRDRREAEIRRSQNPARRRDGREGQNPEHRHPAQSRHRRLATEFRTREGKGPGRNPRIAHAGE